MRESSVAEESYPNPSRKFEKQEGEKSTKDSPEQEPDLTQPGAIEARLKAAFEGEKGQKYIEDLDKWADNPESVRGIGEALNYFDTCLPMRKFRTWWDQRDRSSQLALMYLTTPPPLWLQQAGPLQALIKVGFIKYKGHYNSDPVKMEQEIDKMGNMSDIVAKYGVKFGKYIFPELAGVEPLIDPLLKVKGLGNKTLRNVRRSVYYHRAKYEREELKPVDVLVETNTKVDGLLKDPSNFASNVIQMPAPKSKANPRAKANNGRLAA